MGLMVAPAGAEGKAGSLVDDAGHFYKPLQVRPVRPAWSPPRGAAPQQSMNAPVSHAGAAPHMPLAIQALPRPAAPSDEVLGAGERGSSVTAFGPRIACRIAEY